MKLASYSNNEFVSQTNLNAAETLTRDSLLDITGNLHTPGLINASSLSFSYSNLTITVDAPLPFYALFSDGTLASANGTVDGESSSSATVDFSSLVPSTGSVTAYLVAVSGSVAQSPTTTVGPPVGHPDYSPSFAPYTAYSEQQDTLIFSATLTAPDNTDSLFIASTVLSAGQTTITSSSTAGQVYAGSILTQDVSIIGTLDVGDALTASSAQINGDATVTEDLNVSRISFLSGGNTLLYEDASGNGPGDFVVATGTGSTRNYSIFYNNGNLSVPGTVTAAAGTSGDQLVNYTQLTDGSIDADFNTLTASSAQINGNINATGTVSAAAATSSTNLIPYGQAFQRLSGSPPSTVTLGNVLRTVAQYALTAATTITLEPGSVQGQEITFYGGAYALTLQSNATSGSPSFELPDGSDILSWTIPAIYGNGIHLVWDGANWRARTFGQQVVAPATQDNAAVQLGQFSPGQQSFTNVPSPNPRAVYSTGGTFTAPSAGECNILGLCTQPGGAGFSIYTRANGVNVGAVSGYYAANSAYGTFPVTDGQVVTWDVFVTASAATSQQELNITGQLLFTPRVS